jgi:apolipoprotein N-acyltransferase
MFPGGLPGLALLALRSSVAFALLIDNFDRGPELSGWLKGAGVLLAGALWVGYLTPVVAIMALMLHVLIWLHLGFTSLFLASVVLVDALVLALLGPGAYSVDSYLFGRRMVVLPPR